MHVCEAVEITKPEKVPEMVDEKTEDGMLGSDVAFQLVLNYTSYQVERSCQSERVSKPRYT